MENPRSREVFLDEVLDGLEIEDERFVNDNEPFKVVQSVVNVLLSAMSRYYPPFSFQAIDDNSFFVAKSSTRFEIVISLKYLKSVHLCVEESSLPLGLALVRIQDTSPAVHVWKDLCVRSRFGKEYFSPNFLRSSLSKLLSKVIVDIESVRCSYHIKDGIKTTNTSTPDSLSLDIHIRNVCYSVALLPAIACNEVWPVCAQKWRITKSSLQGDKRRRILRSGVHLVAKPARIGFHWRIWFCEAEKKMLQFDEFPCKRKCLRLLKKVLFGHLGCTFLSSYHLHTLLLHESARFPEKELWLHSKFRQRIRGLLLRLYQCLTTSHCQHFFITSLNLFRGISSGALEEFSRRLQPLLSVDVTERTSSDVFSSRSCVYENSLAIDEITVNQTWL